MARKERKYHYIYKTTNIITKRYYYGMHSTDNLDDGYVGSGKRLWYSINKYGKENHTVEILEFLPNRYSLREREGVLVNEELLGDPMCMNLTLGGYCGFDIINENGKNLYGKNGENGKKNLLHGNEMKQHLIENGNWDNYKTNLSNSLKDKYKTHPHQWFDRKHSEESKKKQSIAASKRTGEKNSQFGSCWITNGTENKKIRRGDNLPNGWELGRTMK